jgi:hypothetical protein
MSKAQLWAALQQSAMVGSDRLPLPQALLVSAEASASASQRALQAALARPSESPAQQLLRASAVAAVCERAGWQPGAQGLAGAAQPAAAPPESRPAPADGGLQSLMRDVLADGPSDLRASMLRTLGQAGQRLPHGLLVLALEQGRQSVELRHWLAPVLGERGRWLGTLNPQWAYAAGVQESADAEQVWQEGSIDQRVALLCEERGTDPARARARFEASLKELGAKERLPMVKALSIGLSLDDEPLLEKLLGDRGKEVREHVAQLLSRLPLSAHSQRLQAWMRAMLQQDDKGQWSVEPPEQGLKEWERDGIALQPHSYFRGGARAWLLQQMVELTPLDFWTRTLGKTPAELMLWSKQSDWKTALRQGWLQALQYQRDVAWIDAVQMLGRDTRSDTLMQSLMAQLTEAEREARWLAQFERDKGKLIEAIGSMAQSVPEGEQLSAAMSQRLVEALHQVLGGKQVTGSWHSYQADQALLSCARMLDVSTLRHFAQLWRSPPASEASPAAVEDRPSLLTRALHRVAGLLAPASTENDPADPGDAGAATAPAGTPLTPEQQARLDRSRLRPWDDENMRRRLERIVDLRLGLDQAFTVLRAQAAGAA